jgi:hypothetical protein
VSEPVDPVGLGVRTVRAYLLRGSAAEVTKDASAFIEQMIRQAWERVQAEGREDEFDAATRKLGSDLLIALAPTLGQFSQTERRSRGRRGSPPQVGVTQIRDVISTVCPLWPFC